MHSVGLEPTKLILTGTRATYQATGDAVYVRVQAQSFVTAVFKSIPGTIFHGNVTLREPVTLIHPTVYRFLAQYVLTS